MSYEHPRIQLTDTVLSAVKKMAGGNPGAITVLMIMIKEVPTIDPQALMGGMGVVMSLDTEDIYEERIWMLYKDVCGQSIVKTLACLRASQLGFISTTQLDQAIDGMGDLDVDDLLVKVKKRLDGFDKVVESISVQP